MATIGSCRDDPRIRHAGSIGRRYQHAINRRVTYWQCAPLHDFGDAHVTPHAPQLLESPRVSTQVPLHTVRFALQEHVLATHDAEVGHVTPHTPQLCLSELRSTQPAPQRVAGAMHVAAHVPPLQTRPPVHDVVQLPQCAGSLASVAHTPPQLTAPLEQAHVPAIHDVPEGHALPQPPQWPGFDATSTQLCPHLVAAPQPVAHAPWKHT
jgi:hypothetical protein